MSSTLILNYSSRQVARATCTTFARGFRAVDKYRLVQVQLTQAIAGVGEAGEIHEVKRGRMRNYLFPQGKANYITRDQGPQLLKGREISSLSESTRKKVAALPPLVFNARLRSLHAQKARPLSGMTILGRGISIQDVKSRLVELGFDKLEAPRAIVEWADQSARKNGPQRGRLTALGEYQARIRFLGGEDVILTVKVEPQVKDEELDDDDDATASATLPIGILSSTKNKPGSAVLSTGRPKAGRSVAAGR